MARGRYVDLVNVECRFGLEIISPVFSSQTFKYYREIKISKSGTLIGYWSQYRDHFLRGYSGYKIIRRTDNYLFLQKQ